MLIPFVLALLLAPAQGSPAHAELHPVDSDIYLELGDVSGLLTELEKAPLVRFLRDERIAGLFAELGHPTNRPLRELVQDGLTTLLHGGKADQWLPGLKTVSASVVALGPGSESTPPAALLAILDFAAPEQAETLRSALIERAPKHEAMSGAVPGVELLHMGEGSKEDVWCVAAGPRLVLGDAPSKPEDYFARAEKKLTGFAASETLRKNLAAFEKPSGTPVFWFALASSLRAIVAKMQAPEEVGIEAVSRLPSDLNPFGSSFVARTQFAGERFVTEMITSASASAAKPIDPAWLEPVPAGTMFVFSSAFDGAAAGKCLREMLAEDEQVAAALAALEQKLGFGFERMLGHLGPGMTVYAGPPAAGLPETRLWIDCDDAAAFTSDFEALFNALGETLPGLQAKTRPYTVKKSGGEGIPVPITTLTLPQSWQQIPMINLAPSFAPVGKKIVFAQGSIDMKSELKRVHGVSGEPIVPGSNPLAAFGFQVPADARAIVAMDWAKLLGGIVGTIKTFAPLMGSESMSFDLNKLPPPELFGQYFKPTFFYSKGATAGLYRRNEASFGPETWLGLGALVVGVTTGMTIDVGEEPDGVVPLQPAGGGQ